MKRPIPVLVLVTACVGWASMASSAPVLVTYDLTGGGSFNSTALLGGFTPQGGTATVRWPVVSSLFTPGSAQIITLKFTHSVGGTLSLTGATGALDPVIQVLGGGASGRLAKYGANYAPTLLSLPYTGSNYVDDLFVRHYAGGSAYFNLLRELTFPGSTRGINVVGVEISRTPEPSSAPLAGLGLLALGGYAARRRARRRTERA